jgi:hypothetical protein
MWILGKKLYYKKEDFSDLSLLTFLLLKLIFKKKENNVNICQSENIEHILKSLSKILLRADCR